MTDTERQREQFLLQAAAICRIEQIRLNGLGQTQEALGAEMCERAIARFMVGPKEAACPPASS